MKESRWISGGMEWVWNIPILDWILTIDDWRTITLFYWSQYHLPVCPGIPRGLSRYSHPQITQITQITQIKQFYWGPDDGILLRRMNVRCASKDNIQCPILNVQFPSNLMGDAFWLMIYDWWLKDKDIFLTGFTGFSGFYLLFFLSFRPPSFWTMAWQGRNWENNPLPRMKKFSSNGGLPLTL